MDDTCKTKSNFSVKCNLDTNHTGILLLIIFSTASYLDVHIWPVFIFFVQTCLISPTCVGKWQSSASLRLFTDSGRTSSAHSTSQRETFPACRSVSCSCCTLSFCLLVFPHLIFCTCVYVCQYSVSLQSEEEIQQQYQRRPGQAVGVTGHGRHMESCLHTASSHFSLPIPLNVTPGFSTDMGQSSVGWNMSISLADVSDTTF